MKAPQSRRHRRIITAVLAVAMIGMTACSGGDAVPLTAKNTESGLAPKTNGFSFANFGAAASPEVFNASDLSTMFGSRACSSGSGDNCTPTAQAAAWAQMVNEARQSGHCEGLAVQASARFASKETPPTVELNNSAEVTHGIMRAFATQFLPEVQDATNEWAKKSLVEILNELSTSFEAGETKYTLGIYTKTGGHAVLPYALEFPSEDLAVIKVYDSNWPGMERYVVVDLKAKQWYFSFSSANPQKDDCAWTGKQGDIDITPISARTAGTCPFCGDGTKVAKSVLLIRSSSDNWSLKTKNGVFTPESNSQNSDVSSRAIRSAVCDEVVKIPEFVLSTDESEFELTLPDTASAYVSNGNSVVRIVTKGQKKREPIVFTENSISVNDTSTGVQVAVDNVIAQVEVDSSIIAIEDKTVTVQVEGENKPVVVDQKNPQVLVTQTDSGETRVEKPSNLVNVVAPVVEELIPEPVKPGLTSTEERSLNNETYVETVNTVPTTPVTAPPLTTTTTTVKKTTTSTIASGAAGNQDSSTSSTSTTVSGNQSTSSSTTSTSSTSSTSSTTTTTTTTTVALNCVFEIDGYGVHGFACSNGTRRGWQGYLTRFSGDTYYFSYGANTSYQYGNYTADYNVQSVPAGFTATGRYTGAGCHPYGCP